MVLLKFNFTAKALRCKSVRALNFGSLHLCIFAVIIIFTLFAFRGHCMNPGVPDDSLFKARKSITAIRISKPPKIDGIMDEPFWKDVPAGKDFVEYGPRNGTVPPFATEIRVAYDDNALYISAVMLDPHPDSILKEFGRRDQVDQLTTDYISFDILPYNDGLNMYEFKVTPAGLQNDCKYSAVGQDITWDAVWQSAAKITPTGWVVEIAIPYSALRFPRIDKQVWGINFWRSLHRRNEWSTWSFVDNKVQDIFKYYGTLVGINDIKPPVRLSFTPYISGYIQKTPDSKNGSYLARGGLDLRYGINESYTLDMMLIPDFGQVQSDDQVLNLSPFEVKYDDKRQFFTEGTELFNKCNIFYTRRVGSTPKDYYAPYDSVHKNEVVSNNPEETRIINATKISGRNSKGLGIGFFNAMTTNTWATITDTITGKSRRMMTQPFTNYNVLVIDQNLKNSSYITFINTNFWTPDDKYSANVTGVETQLNNKKRTFAFMGRMTLSQKYERNLEPNLGYSYTLVLFKPSGKFQYQFVRQELNQNYDPNDMGFLTNNNQAVNQLKLNYNIYDPFWFILNSQSEFYTTYTTLYKPNSFESLRFLADNSTFFKNFWSLYFEEGIYPLGTSDFYEPRTWGRVYKKPLSYSTAVSLGTNTRKEFRVQGIFSYMNSPENNHFDYAIELIPRFRFSDRFAVNLDITWEKNMNSYGWVETQTDSLNNELILFGRRDITTLSNILNAQYVFSTKTSLSLRLRHYWSTARYFSYYSLNSKGFLDPSNQMPDHNINYNAFSIDLQFVWYFAPGSEMSFVWKNDINTQDNLVIDDYWNDIKHTINAPQSNSLSVKILYYLDYQSIKKAFSRRKNAEV